MLRQPKIEPSWPGLDQNDSQRRAGLTVLELLITVGIVTLLLALIVPAVQQAREGARRIQCSNNLRQVGIALHQHHDVQGHLPAGWSKLPRTMSAWSWTVRLLPYLDQSSIYERIHLDQAVDAAAHDAVRHQQLPVMLCPSDLIASHFHLYCSDDDRDSDGEQNDGFAESDEWLVELPSSNYVGVFGTSDPDSVDGRMGEGVFLQNRQVNWRDLTQGLSHVMVVSERTARKLPSTWLGVRLDGEDAVARMTGYALLGPNRADADECELDSRHPNMINALFADGHVQSVHNDVERTVYQKMARRSE